MRVDHILTSLGAGGAEVLVTNLALEQRVRGHDVFLWLLCTPDVSDSHHKASEQERRLSESGIQVAVIGRSSRDVLGATRALRERRGPQPGPAIIHAHSAIGAIVAAIAGRRSPVLLTIHNTHFGFPRIFFVALNLFVHQFISCSNAVAEAFRPYIWRQTAVIPNGVPMPNPRHGHDTSQRQRVAIVAVGRLAPQKNYPRLVDAVTLMKRDSLEGAHSFTVQIAGGGDALDGLRHLAKQRNVDDVLTFLGPVSDVQNLLAESDVFVSSSDHEGLPIALLEAMAAGLACVVTPFPAAFSVLEDDGGIITSSFGSEALAESLRRVVDDEKLRVNLGRRARERSQSFSLATCAERYLLAYEKIARNNNI